MYRHEAGPHGLAVDVSGHADDRGVRAWTDAPDMEIRDAGVALGFDMLAHFRFQMVVGRVEQHSRRVAHKGPGPDRDDDRTDDPHHRIEPDPAEVGAGQQRSDRQHRGQGVGEHMDEGRAQIVIAMARGVPVVGPMNVGMIMAVIVMPMVLMSMVIMAMPVMVAAAEEKRAHDVHHKSQHRDDVAWSNATGRGYSSRWTDSKAIPTATAPRISAEAKPARSPTLPVPKL